MAWDFQQKFDQMQNMAPGAMPPPTAPMGGGMPMDMMPAYLGGGGAGVSGGVNPTAAALVGESMQANQPSQMGQILKMLLMSSMASGKPLVSVQTKGGGGAQVGGGGGMDPRMLMMLMQMMGQQQSTVPSSGTGPTRPR